MWLMLIPLVLCGEAAVRDLRTREIPDNVSLRIFVTGLLATGLSGHSVTLAGALMGTVIGLLAVLPFTLTEGIGGGDLKLVAALGTWLGPSSTLGLLFWSAMSGMLAAGIAQARRRRDLPLAPAIATGLLVTVLWPEGVDFLIQAIRAQLPN